MTHTAIRLVAGLLCAFALAAPATAERADEIKVTFEYRSDLAPAQNYSEFQRLALRECRSSTRRTLAELKHERACANALLDKAVARLNRLELADVHHTRTGRRVETFQMLADTRG